MAILAQGGLAGAPSFVAGDRGGPLARLSSFLKLGGGLPGWWRRTLFLLHPSALWMVGLLALDRRRALDGPVLRRWCSLVWMPRLLNGWNNTL